MLYVACSYSYVFQFPFVMQSVWQNNFKIDDIIYLIGSLYLSTESVESSSIHQQTETEMFLPI